MSNEASSVLLHFVVSLLCGKCGGLMSRRAGY